MGTATPLSAAPDWGTLPPENLPRLTVRWLDRDQARVFAVEGERYRCRVALDPARIEAIEVDGRDLLGPEGISFGFTTAEGAEYVPAPLGLTPDWQVWRGRGWAPATSSRARMNVWSCGPHYWDAHVLDIPFLPASELEALAAAATEPPLLEWRFDRDTTDWEALNHCTGFGLANGCLVVSYEGEDPYFQSPPIDVPGPVEVRLRVRSLTAGHAALYWAADDGAYRGDQHAIVAVREGTDFQDLRIPLPVQGRLKRLRIDPPGSFGRFEIQSADILPRPAPGGKLRPIRGEVVFHAFPNRLNLEFRLEPQPDDPVPAAAAWRAGTTPARVEALHGRPVLCPENAAILATTDARFDTDTGSWQAPLTGLRPGTWWTLRPRVADVPLPDLFRDECMPFLAARVEVRDGHWRGYDAPSGLYLVDAAMAPPAYSFNAAFDNPNRRIAVTLRLRGDEHPRAMVIKCASGTGILPATVLTDEHGFLLPTPVQSCKNFAGEREEPDDAAYGDAYFPITLQPNQERSFQVVHLFQRWGDHALKQVTSIRFFHIYWHLSTGVSETTCFTIPAMLLNGEYVRIPDYRPYSGPFWAGQPQHDCLSWPGLLQYRSGGERVRLLYDSTAFESIAPNLARFTMHFRSSDDAATVRVTAMEIPHSDETRTFLSLRCDWHRTATVDGDARNTFRWLNVNDKKRPRMLLSSDPEGRTRSRLADAPEGLRLQAELLRGPFPFLGTHGMAGSQGAREYHSFVLVRAFRARLGGQDQDAPAASAEYSNRNGNYWFGAPQETLTLRPADFIEADLMLMPHAEAVEPDLKPERERLRFGSEGPRIGEVTVGRKVSDFPATVSAENEVARFTIEGGLDALPIVVKGFRHWGVPLLWQNDIWQNQQAHGGDGYQVNPDGEGTYRFVFLVPLRHGMRPNLTVTRAECSSGIATVRDRNGFPEIEARTPGEFRLKAPALFAPGTNRLTEANDIVDFTGSGASVRAVPVSAQVKGNGTVTVEECSGEGFRATVSGEMTMNLSRLERHARYEVTVDTNRETRDAGRDGLLTLTLGPGQHTVAVRKTAADRP
ncbi:MAG: hypothetical protein JXR77_19635 [Lentisphaeria bacterium]|nr:hypothetical protein [Lentisphaeria bacterium]